jgi:hypothetical protein
MLSHRIPTFRGTLSRPGAVGALLSLLLPLGASAYDVVGIGAGSWGASDAAIGVVGWLIEDFEDTALVPALSVEIDNNGARTRSTTLSRP